MPTQLYTNSAIYFIAARNFTYDGVDYEIGDEFPQDAGTGRLDLLVRTRRVYAVVDNPEDKPRHWHHHVWVKDVLLKKLGKDENRTRTLSAGKSTAEAEYDPAEHTVEEVKEYVEEHPDQAEEILEAELEGKERKTLVPALEEAVPFDPNDHTMPEVLEYLTSPDTSPEEQERVLELERNGKARKGILGE